MTGPLVLPGDPTTPTQAADKHYVDTNIAGVAGGLGQKVSLSPSGDADRESAGGHAAGRSTT